jgi:hypothetical protein
VRRALAGLCLALAATGCGATAGVRDEGPKVQEIAAEQATPSENVDVYLVRYGGPAGVARVVPPAPSLARGALEALLRGPSPGEQASGYSSAIPPGAQLANFTVADGTATVDLVGKFEPILQDKFTDSGPGARRRQALLEQIVWTLSQFPGITNVQVSLNGEPISLVQSFEGASLTKDLFGVAAAGYADSAACQPGSLPKHARTLKLLQPVAGEVSSDGFVHFAAQTTRKAGRVVVQLLQGARVVRNVDRADLAYNQPKAAHPGPCQQFSGAIEVPWGVTGPVTFRLAIRPGPSGGNEVAVDRPITIMPGTPDA